MLETQNSDRLRLEMQIEKNEKHFGHEIRNLRLELKSMITSVEAELEGFIERT